MNYNVYIHICPNGKRYVGLTTQRLSRRWRNGKGYANNKHFTNAILKYGWDNIEHISYKVNTEQEMFYLEKYLIAFYNTTNSLNGYNHSEGGEFSGSGCKWKYTEEQKTAKRGPNNPMYGKHHPLDVRKKISENQPCKQVVQYTLDDQLVKVWRSMSDAANNLGLHKTNISACCRGKQNSAGGYKWKYL